MKKFFLIITIAFFTVSSVYVAIEASATGAEMRALEERQQTLESAKSELEATLVKGVSGSAIDAKGVSLGFTKPTELIYLNGNAGKDQALINSFSR
ncbi:MAG: hypothetical protein UU32_C0005G0013 [Candidatus Woesebacteria bacterium GW2011_GWB1_41_10]|uniref:Cell division protein FtsL n=1 Tax=Candidatus Woesebacteria bacterium GW2011_GWB1_41_10 TaxID=1618577 RepID=A0A0G0UEU1_9BACT|nr:MAG: hypothetical protein UU32_C0005G0013 [Candidatus Woesebacteria bacterium GW2011_GWB1_41_10]KKS88130.1 MAG: hypothetical protein UV64_C0029G0003 [Parcubacteria group bacterium GW2011_GWC1_43_11b]